MSNNGKSGFDGNSPSSKNDGNKLHESTLDEPKNMVKRQHLCDLCKKNVDHKGTLLGGVVGAFVCRKCLKLLGNAVKNDVKNLFSTIRPKKCNFDGSCKFCFPHGRQQSEMEKRFHEYLEWSE